MHLHVNSKRSQSSVGSFVSASFVSQHESLHCSLEVGEMATDLTGGCKHSLVSAPQRYLRSIPVKLGQTFANGAPSASPPWIL